MEDWSRSDIIALVSLCVAILTGFVAIRSLNPSFTRKALIVLLASLAAAAIFLLNGKLKAQHDSGKPLKEATGEEPPQPAATVSPQPTPPIETAKVKITLTAIGWFYTSHTVVINGKEYGELERGDSRYYNVAPGTVSIQLKRFLDNTNVLSFEVHDGETVEVLCAVTGLGGKCINFPGSATH